LRILSVGQFGQHVGAYQVPKSPERSQRGIDLRFDRHQDQHSTPYRFAPLALGE